MYIDFKSYNQHEIAAHETTSEKKIIMAMRSNGSMDSLNSSNSTSNQTKLDESDKDIIEMLEDPMGLERVVFNAINEGDRDTLIRVFEKHPNPTTILQMLLTTSYPNRDGFYKHDADVLQAAHELLGQRLIANC